MRSAALTAAALIAIAASGVAMAEGIPELTIQTQWMKFCFNGPEADFKRICGTRAQLRKQDDNSLLVTVDLLDRGGEAKKILRVVFPLGMQLAYGTRLIVHGNDPLQGPYAVCTAAGCAADYDATPALLNGMKASQWVIAQAIDQSGKPFTATLSLAGFWVAHGGRRPSRPSSQSWSLAENPGWMIR